MTNPMIEAAKAYTRKGWTVLPLHGVQADGVSCTCKKAGDCTSAGKHPRALDWSAATPMTDAEIEDAWSGWRATHGLGVVTGTPSGWWVLDVDPDNNGIESIKRLQDDYAPLTAALAQKTGSGGYHLAFAMPLDFVPTNRVGGLKAYPGLDVRGQGGQVVVAPSRSAKGSYSWLSEGEPEQAPDWLLDLLRPTEPTGPLVGLPSAVPLEGITDEETLRLEGYSARVRDLEVGRLVAMAEAAGLNYIGDPWNETTFKVACSLLELANSPWTLYDLDQAARDLFHNAPQDDGFGRMEIEKCWRSAVGKVGENCRPYPVARPDTASMISSWLTEPGVRVDPILLKGKTPPPGMVVEAEPMPEPTMPMRSWDDLGNAMRLVDHFGTYLRWVAEPEQWALYLNGRWELVKPNVVQGYVQRMFDELILATEGMHYSDIPDDDEKPDDTERARFEKWLKTQRMSARITACSKEAQGRAELYASKADFDAHPLLLNVTNGVVNLQTGELMPARPDLMLMKQSNVAYDPLAPCSQWMKFLERVQPDQAMQQYLQRVLGYSITGDTREQSFFLHHGDGANGKSICTAVVGSIMGDYGQTVAPSTLLSGAQDEHPTGVAMMDGRRWLPATETAPGRRLDEEKVKNLTGGEPVAARFMGKDFFEFVPVGKIHLTTNHLPRLSDAKSIWRRIHLIKWGVSIPVEEQDRLLESKLKTELPGILAWLVRGSMQWLQQGLRPPQGALDDLSVYRDDSDTFGDFLRERTIDAPKDVLCPVDALYQAYNSWCFSQGIRKPMSHQAFVATMLERKFVRHRTATVRGFLGLVVKQQVAAIGWDT